MTRIDWLVLRRLGARIALTVVVMFGLIALAVSLDIARFAALSRAGGPLLALLDIVNSATRWLIDTLSFTVLIGAVIGLLDLQARGELTVIKASGISIWQILRAPLVATLLLGAAVALVADTATLMAARALSGGGPQGGSSGPVWLEQTGSGGRYILHALHAQATGTELGDVTFYMMEAPQRDRIEAAEIRLVPGAWLITKGTRYRPDGPPQALVDTRIATATTAGDMQVRLTSVGDLTAFELSRALSEGVSDPALRGAVLTSLSKLAALPFLLAGSVLIAAAFTSGYLRTNRYGVAVLYGIVLGFVVYVLTEMANRAGIAGVLDPTFAAVGPAFVAIVVGLTVLLYREDGRA